MEKSWEKQVVMCCAAQTVWRDGQESLSGTQKVSALIRAGASTQEGVEAAGLLQLAVTEPSDATCRENNLATIWLKKNNQTAAFVCVISQLQVWESLDSWHSQWNRRYWEGLGAAEMSRSPSLLSCPLFSYIKRLGTLDLETWSWHRTNCQKKVPKTLLNAGTKPPVEPEIYDEHFHVIH